MKNDFYTEFEDIDVIEIDNVKEVEILIKDELYLIRLDYNSLINIADNTGISFEEMFYKVFIANKGLYNYLLQLLTYCCINKIINDENFFRKYLEPTAENITMLEDVMKYLAEEVFDTDTMNYINDVVRFKYLKTEPIKKGGAINDNK